MLYDYNNFLTKQRSDIKKIMHWGCKNECINIKLLLMQNSITEVRYNHFKLKE